MAQAPDKGPWRTVVWGKRKRTEYIKAIKEYTANDGSEAKIRILLLGPSGVGKSSFVNSVFSIFRGSIGNRADGGKPTSGFRTYFIRNGKGRTFLNLALCDAMGLSEKNGAGLLIDDIVSIIQGHVPDGYQFSPTSPMTPETAGYVAAPKPYEMIHCVVYVMDASTVSDVSAELQKKLGEIRQRVTSLNIPQLVLMTKVDRADPSVIKDIRHVYESEIIREKAEQLAALLGDTSIFPVKNYVPNEVKLNDNCDVLLLTAVNEMLRFADNYMDDIATKSENDIAAKSENDIAATSENDIAATSENDIAAKSENDIAAKSENDIAAKSVNDITERFGALSTSG